MHNSADRIFEFIRREKLYVFLLIVVLLINFSFSFLNQFLVDAGLYELFAEKGFEAGDIIPAEEIQAALAANSALYLIFAFLFIVFIFFVLAGLIVNIVYLYLNQKGKSPLARTRILESAKWDFWDICKVGIIFLFAQRMIWFAEIFLFSAVPYLQDKSTLRLMLSATLVDVAAIAAVLHFVINKKRQEMTSLGLTGKSFFTNIKYGVVGYIGLIPVLALAMYLTTVLFRKFNIPIEPQPVIVMLHRENHIPTLIYMGLFTSLLGPFLEEIFFRGFTYGVFKKRLGIFWGIVISAVFFAYIHANLASLLPIFCLGILLTYLYEKTGSLIPSITVHVIHNSLSLFFLLFVKAIAG